MGIILFKKIRSKIEEFAYPLVGLPSYQKYLDIHFKKWAKKYHLDNPRNTDSLFSRFKKDDEN